MLVTASARGLGRACALACAHAGADIALGLRDKASGSKLVAEIEALGRRALPLQMDMERLDEIDAAVAAAIAHFGRIDVLVNNAGVSAGEPGGERHRGGFRHHAAHQPEGHVLRQPGGRAP